MSLSQFHCFTSKPLDKTHSQLRSHQKQRALFQELFAKCTGVIVSAGNETIWEAVCRGVPVLTIPTEGHGEQLLNAAVHARNFPTLVRARPVLRAEDLDWLVGYDTTTPAAVAESASLREKVVELQTRGSALLGGVEPPKPTIAQRVTLAASVSAQAVVDVSQAMVDAVVKVVSPTPGSPVAATPAESAAATTTTVIPAAEATPIIALSAPDAIPPATPGAEGAAPAKELW